MEQTVGKVFPKRTFGFSPSRCSSIAVPQCSLGAEHPAGSAEGHSTVTPGIQTVPGCLCSMWDGMAQLHPLSRQPEAAQGIPSPEAISAPETAGCGTECSDQRLGLMSLEIFSNLNGSVIL